MKTKIVGILIITALFTMSCNSSQNSEQKVSSDKQHTEGARSRS